MHKKIILIICLLLLSGCKQITDNNNYIEKINNCLNNNTKITNEVATGYKYYVPKGIRQLKNYDYNQIFLADGCYLYLYVDIISYFHTSELKEKDNTENTYYYETINHQDKTGYISINKTETSDYHLEIVYNYSKIEGYVPEKKLNKIVTLSTIILNSIEYNDKMIEKILDGDLGEFSELSYEVDKPEGASSDFSQILEEYVKKEEDTEQLPDE